MATLCNSSGVYPKLKGKRRKMAEKLTNPEFDGNISKLCDEIGVARSTFYRWMDETDFRGYLDYLINKYTDSELANVWKSLVSKATSGNTEAIKLYFEMKNMYKQQVDINGGVVFLADDLDA